MNNQLLLGFNQEVKTKKAIIIGQAPPKKLDLVPFRKTRLYSWLDDVGVSKAEALNHIEFDALVGIYPGKGKNNKGDAKPSENDIKKHIPFLIDKINTLGINLIIPVGKMAIERVLGIDKIALNEYVGKQFKTIIFNNGKQKYSVIPLPHPSGLSSWSFKPENKILLEKALIEIKKAIKNED